ncbi:MAG: recombination protein RecR [Alphaproteobacteria bacterium]|nr:recombination protein RecR [Alphaproteobacteria bacterium]MCK5556595.1 recombination protein RecR [Alphaproteobacteria bacterium]
MIGTEIEHLIKLISRLPGIGPRSAQRVVLNLLKNRESLMQPLSKALELAAEIIVECPHCHNLDTVSPCSLCSDPGRDTATICVVEDISDLWTIEKTSSFKGSYHVLGGILSALDGIGPEDLSIQHLLNRAKAPNVKEIIIALNATIDGQTTAHYLSDCLHHAGVTTTQLAHGVPIGGQIDYMDDGTISTALKARKAV